MKKTTTPPATLEPPPPAKLIYAVQLSQWTQGVGLAGPADWEARLEGHDAHCGRGGRLNASFTGYGKVPFSRHSGSSVPRFRITVEELRPTIKVHPWKPKEVPLGAWFRRRGSDLHRLPLFGVHPAGVTLSHGRGDCKGLSGTARALAMPFDKLAENWDYSTDSGETWQPAGRVEEVYE